MNEGAVSEVGLTVALCFNLGTDLVPRDDEPPDLHCELDSEATVNAIHGALEGAGHKVVRIEADAGAPEKLAACRPDIVFNIAEGLRGESRESYIPAVCDAVGIPYTGSGVLSLAVALDKSVAKRICASEGVPIAPFRVVRPGGEIDVAGLRFPLFVKPLREGSSMGISLQSKVDDESALCEAVLSVHGAYRQPALVEEFLPGREFTVGLLGNEEPIVFPEMEIHFASTPDGHDVYSRQFKAEWYTWDYYRCPAPLGDFERRRLHEVALAAYRALGCRDLARVDIRCDAQGRPYVLEVNPIPGLSPGFSDYPRMAEVAGYSHPALVVALLDTAVARSGIVERAAVAATAS